MRLASAMVAGLGASLGALKGLLFTLGAIVVVLRGQRALTSYDLLEIGSELALAVFCLLGAAGAVLVLVEGRLRVGVLLMLAGAAGTALTTVVHGLLLPLTQPPDYQAVARVFTNVGFYLLWSFPVPFLLAGAALAFGARQRAER